MLLPQLAIQHDPKRHFQWCGKLRNLNTSNQYCVELKTYKFIKDDGSRSKKQQIIVQRQLLDREHRRSLILYKKRLQFSQHKLNHQALSIYQKLKRESGKEPDHLACYQLIAPLETLSLFDESVLEILFRSPPTHQINVFCRPVRGGERIIFSASFCFRGFRCTPTQAAYESYRFIIHMIEPFKYGWLLMKSVDSNAFYLDCIVSRCRHLLPVKE